MKPLILAISGRKQAGKSSVADFIKSWYYIVSNGLQYNIIQETNGSIKIWDINNEPGTFDPGNYKFTNLRDIVNSMAENSGVHIYNFADRLKELCVNILGLTSEQCYGTDDQKNSLTQYIWDRMPEEIRRKYSKEQERILTGISSELETGDPIEQYDYQPKLRDGHITAREILQLTGTDIFRNMFSEIVWANATINKIKQDKPQIALIADCRFPSEVDAVINAGGYIIRLDRVMDEKDHHASETALDNYPFKEMKEQCLIIDNTYLDINEKNELVISWLSKIINKMDN